MSKGGGTIGYHYLGSLLFGLGRGPVNALTHIKVGGKLAWEGEVAGDGATVINKPELFGGEKKEGGIQGIFRSLMGEKDQLIPEAATMTIGSPPNATGTLPYLKTSVGGDVGELRGRHMVWYDGLLSSMNPYIKPWEFRRWRTTAGWHNNDTWYGAKATIYLKGGAIRAMNPAHIVYQANTDPAWGRGLDRDELDDDSFTYAANLFCAEEFGLCLEWQRRDEIGNFIQTVCDHAAMVQYTDRETGKICIKAIRDDYVAEDLPHFELGTGLLSITEDNSGSSEGVADEIVINGKDPITNQKIEGRAHNLAVRMSRSGPSAIASEYPGLPTIELCNRVAERERNIGGALLRKFTVKLDRAGFKLHPGAVFRVSYPPRNLSGIVLRVGEVDDGNMIEGEITVRAVQDVFSLPLTSFVTPVENTYEDATAGPPLQADFAAYEASYRDIYRRTNDSVLDAIDEDTSLLAVTAARPNTSNIEYKLSDRAEGDPTFRSTGPYFFTSRATLVGAISATETEITFENMVEALDEDDIVGLCALITQDVKSEFVGITAVDLTAGTMTITRGAVDTWPADFGDGAAIWLVDDDLAVDPTAFSAGEEVEAKVLTRTSSEIMAEADAESKYVQMVGRAFRPYPPADVKVSGNSIYDTGAVTEGPVTWVERNRLTQADVIVGFFDAAVADEAGTTYEIDILDEAGEDVVAVYEVTSPWTYEEADQIADGTDGYSAIKARIFAVRGGLRSLGQRSFLIRGDTVADEDDGYGFNYGLDYG